MSDQIVDQLLEVQHADVVSRLRAEVARLTAALAEAEFRAQAFRDDKALLLDQLEGSELRISDLKKALAAAEARADKMEASLRWADAYLTDTLVHGGQIADEWHRWWNESLRPALNAAALAEQPGDRGPA